MFLFKANSCPISLFTVKTLESYVLSSFFRCSYISERCGGLFLIHSFIKFFLTYTNFSSILTIFVISPEYIFNLKFSVVPIFGVLTHKDKINENDEDFRTLEKDFREGLGLPDNRFLLCTTYCDDYDKHHGKSRLDQRHPELDIPILKLMRQVSVNLNHDRKLGKLAQYKFFK